MRRRVPLSGGTKLMDKWKRENIASSFASMRLVVRKTIPEKYSRCLKKTATRAIRVVTWILILTRTRTRSSAKKNATAGTAERMTQRDKHGENGMRRSMVYQKI